MSSLDTVKETVMDYCTFREDEIYVLLLLARKKENNDQVESQKEKRAQRFLVQNEEEVDMALELFSRTIELFPEITYRIYISVNPRSLVKGLKEFQNKIIQLQYDLLNGNEEAYRSIQKMGSEWKSILANKKCRADRRFLWDVDFRGGQQELDDLIEELEVQEVFYWGDTNSGQAIVTSPFNIKKLPDIQDLCIKTDSYLYLGIFNKEQKEC